MSQDQRRVRLPELPIFKKYSLAVRQEFAPAKELVGLLERSLARVAKLAEALPPSSAVIEAGPEEIPGPDESAIPSEPSIAPRKPKGAASKAKSKAKPKPVRGVVRVSTKGTPVQGASKKKASTSSRKRR